MRKKIVTLDMLKEVKACILPRTFERLFPRGASWPKDVQKCEDLRLNWMYAAQSLRLSGTAVYRYDGELGIRHYTRGVLNTTKNYFGSLTLDACCIHVYDYCNGRLVAHYILGSDDSFAWFHGFCCYKITTEHDVYDDQRYVGNIRFDGVTKEIQPIFNKKKEILKKINKIGKNIKEIQEFEKRRKGII